MRNIWLSVGVRGLGWLPVLAMVLYSCGPRMSCEQVHTGSFLHQNEAGIVDMHITRTAESQVEYYPELGATCRFRVTWLNDCQYTLVLESGNDACYAALPDSKLVVVTILSVSAHDVDIRSQIEGTGYVTHSKLLVSADK